MTSQTFHLPDVLEDWPWTRRINPHLTEGRKESAKWLATFTPFSPKRQAAFDACDFALFTALSFPDCGSYDFRSGCDLNNVFFVLDEHSDIAAPSAAQEMCDASKDAVVHPDKPRPDGEHMIGELTRQFWQRTLVTFPKLAQERFVATWSAYVDSVAEQARRRDDKYICTLDEYFLSRRENIGVKPSLPWIEATFNLNIPHEVMAHPAIQSLVQDATDLVIYENDLVSYKKELMAGDTNYNLVAIIMATDMISLQDAVNTVAAMCNVTLRNFLATMEDVLLHKNGVPSWGAEVDEAVSTYIDGLGMFVRGIDEWYWESKRYFKLDDEGRQVKDSRIVTLA